MDAKSRYERNPRPFADLHRIGLVSATVDGVTRTMALRESSCTPLTIAHGA